MFLLNVVFFIIKLIFKIILIILGILLLIALCILFVPIRYDLKGKYNEKDGLSYSAKVTYLLHIFSVGISDVSKELVIRIFGIKLKKFSPGKKKGEKNYEAENEMFEEMSREFNEKIKENEEEFKNFEKSLQKQEEDIVYIENDIEKPVYNIEETKEKLKEEQKSTYKVEEINGKSDEESDEDEKSIIEKIKDKIIGVFGKIKHTFTGICGIIKKVFKTKESISDFISDENNINAFKHVKAEVFRFLKHIRPRYAKGHIYFGFEDPSITGKLLGVYYAIFKHDIKGFEVVPFFEEEKKDVDVHLKGRLQLYVVALIGLKLYKDKDLMNIVRQRRKDG